MTNVNMASQKEIMVRLELMLEQEEIYQTQRARANWLRSGDSNTSFFHNYAKKRKKKNTIKGLVDEQGVFQEDGMVMRNIIQGYFQNLFTTKVGEPDPTALAEVQHKVTQEMNEGLLAPFSYEKVRKALFWIRGLKEPGLDGLHDVF